MRSDGAEVTSHRATKQQKIDSYIRINYLNDKASTNKNKKGIKSMVGFHLKVTRGAILRVWRYKDTDL